MDDNNSKHAPSIDSNYWMEVYAHIKFSVNWSAKIRIIVAILNRPIPNVATEIGFSLNGFNAILKGIHIPSFAMLMDMIRFLHVKPEWLFSLGVDCEKSDLFIRYDKIRGTRHEIAERIKAQRKLEGLSQSLLAESSGISSKTICCAENEKMDLLEESIKKISDAFNIGFYWILSGDELSKDYPTSQKMIDFLWNCPSIRKNIWALIPLGSCPAQLIHTHPSSLHQPTFKKTVDRTPDAQAIGNRIHSLREYHNLSQRAFADKTDISKSAISLWEKGKTLPDDFSIRRIGEAFDVGIDWIKYGDESRKNYPCDHKMIEFLNENPAVRKAIRDMM